MHHIPTVQQAEQHFPTQLQVPAACVVNLGPIREVSMAVACVVTIIYAQSPALKSITPVKYPILCLST